MITLSAPIVSRRGRGFSLTELLVAMVIGLVLLGGLVTLMVNSKKNYSQQDYNARLQENARFAMQFLSYDIRMGGYYGCSNDIINSNTTLAFAVPDPGTDPNEVSITYGEPYDAGSDVVVNSVNSSSASTITWVLNQIPDTWAVGDNVVVADCGSAVVTAISAIDTSGGTITVNKNFSRSFDPTVTEGGDITVRRLITNTYSVEASGESGIPVLERNGQELVEGVENIRLLYQASLGGGFVDGTSAPENPVAVQLGALLRSVSNEQVDAGSSREFGSGEDITVDAGQHQLLDQNLNVGQLRGQRRVFSTTLAVRNRPL